jgi:hypothetical protein
MVEEAFREIQELDNVRISNDSIQTLNEIPNLNKILLQGTRINREGMRQLKKANPKLRIIR